MTGRHRIVARRDPVGRVPVHQDVADRDAVGRDIKNKKKPEKEPGKRPGKEPTAPNPTLRRRCHPHG